MLTGNFKQVHVKFVKGPVFRIFKEAEYLRKTARKKTLKKRVVQDGS